jgi:hypothetical protein
MWNKIKNVFTGILEGIAEGKKYKLYGHDQWYTNYYLSQSTDAADLKKRQEDLRARGYL